MCGPCKRLVNMYTQGFGRCYFRYISVSNKEWWARHARGPLSKSYKHIVLMILLCSYSIGLHRAVKEKQNEKISHRKNRLVCHSKRNLSARNQNISIIDYKTGADYPEPPYVLYPWVNPFRRRIIFRTGFPAKIHCFRERPHIAVVRKKNGVGRGKLANKFSPCSTTVFLYILSIPSFTIEGSWLLVKTVNIWL